MEWLASICTITWDIEGCLTDSITNLPLSSSYFMRLEIAMLIQHDNTKS